MFQKDSQRIKISKGITLSYFYYGLLLTSGSVLLAVNGSYISLILGLLLLPVGISVFLSYKGVVIDLKENQILSYFLLLFFKVGTWERLDVYKTICLLNTNKSQVMASRGSVSTVRTKTYDIYLRNYNHKKELHLQEFTDYEEAKKFLYKYAEILKMEAFDEVEAIHESIAERGRRR